MLTTRHGAGGHLPAGRRSLSCQEASVIDRGGKNVSTSFRDVRENRLVLHY